jgi:hypothetical protein
MGSPVDVDELVPFTYTATMFSGHRQWFRYLNCGRRCRKIYGGRYFRCRLCHHLRYASQRVRPDQYASERACKLAKRLHYKWGGTTEDEYDFPPKPPRMRWATYSRLEAQYDNPENRWVVGIMTQFGRFRQVAIRCRERAEAERRMFERLPIRRRKRIQVWSSKLEVQSGSRDMPGVIAP